MNYNCLHFLVSGVKVIDWQFIGAMPPMLDFTFWAFTNCHPDIVKDNLEKVCHTYYDKFATSCQQFQVEVPFSLDQFKQDMTTKGMTTMFILYMFFYDPVGQEPKMSQRLRAVFEHILQEDPDFIETWNKSKNATFWNWRLIQKHRVTKSHFGLVKNKSFIEICKIDFSSKISRIFSVESHNNFDNLEVLGPVCETGQRVTTRSMVVCFVNYETPCAGFSMPLHTETVISRQKLCSCFGFWHESPLGDTAMASFRLSCFQPGALGRCTAGVRWH